MYFGVCFGNKRGFVFCGGAGELREEGVEQP